MHCPSPVSVEPPVGKRQFAGGVTRRALAVQVQLSSTDAKQLWTADSVELFPPDETHADSVLPSPLFAQSSAFRTAAAQSQSASQAANWVKHPFEAHDQHELKAVVDGSYEKILEEHPPLLGAEPLDEPTGLPPVEDEEGVPADPPHAETSAQPTTPGSHNLHRFARIRVFLIVRRPSVRKATLRKKLTGRGHARSRGGTRGRQDGTVWAAGVLDEMTGRSQARTLSLRAVADHLVVVAAAPHLQRRRALADVGIVAAANGCRAGR